MGFFRLDVPYGHEQFGKVVPCDNPFHYPERLARLADLSNLNPADLSRRLRDIQPNDDNLAMLDAARAIIAKPYGWLYIWGGPGNAKTEALIAIVNELNTGGKGPAMYITLARLIEWVRDAFRDGAQDSYTNRFERALHIKAMAIDEMDKARETDFSEEFRFHFLDERYRQAARGETVTIFASNTDPAKLPEPIYDRIRDGRFKIVENTAASARPHMRRQL